MRTSYAQNDFGTLLTSYIVSWRPSSLVELGVLDGFSTISIANGIKRLQELEVLRGSSYVWPKLDAYDLFDDYKYKHGELADVQQRLKEYSVADYVNICKGDAYEVHKNYRDIQYDRDGNPGNGLDFLHIDISNTGASLRNLMELWHPKISARGLVIIEGGSEERDNVEWMRKYCFPSIKQEVTMNPMIQKYYIYGTYFAFPSMTVLLRKWWNVD